MSDRRVLAIVEAALDLDGDTRRNHLDAACAGDAALRAQVDGLLRAHAASTGFLEPPPRASTTGPTLPRDLGPYRLLAQLGAGGMGLVYLAERRDGAFEQRVAIKILAGSFATPDTIRRAEAERQFLAWLDHPNIARILDGGRTPEGQPYVVMEHVDGDRIDAWCRSAALGLRARVTLFLQVLAAVDAAHRALIIHRDLKPGNVMVTRAGQVKLLDFGIAKSLDDRLARDATRTGLQPLTPQYASPEQLAGRPLTTACDVYALGLLLFELLAGRPAHDDDGASLLDLERRRREQVPPRVSASVDASALGLAPRAAAEWRRQLIGDLDRVLGKALAPEPARRYASAQAFADDLQRWLERRPVLARGGGALYRAGRFVRRHRVPVAAAALALIALFAGLGISLHQAERARAAAERASRANDFLIGIVGYGDPRVSGNAVRLIDALDHAAAQIPYRLAGQPQLEGDIRHALGEAYLGLERLDAAQEQLERADTLRAADGGNAYAATLDVLAMLAWRRDDTARAEQLLQQALAHCGSDAAGRLQRASVLSDHAALLGALGRFDEALPMAQEAVALGDTIPGATLANRAISWGNLATAFHGLGRYDEAADAYAHSAALLEAEHPLPEFDLAINDNNRALLFDRLGRPADALPFAARSVERKRRVMGNDYPGLVWPLADLASYQASVGQDAASRASLDEAWRLAPTLFALDSADAADLHLATARVRVLLHDDVGAAVDADKARALYTALGQPDAAERASALLDEVRARKQGG